MAVIAALCVAGTGGGWARPPRARALAPLPPLAKPFAVRFQLADGVRVAGELTACDNDGIDGSFGRRQWIELDVEDAWKLHERVMDVKSASDWVNLGRVMLLASEAQPRGASKADTAFRRAVQLDEAMQPEIERVKDDFAQRREQAREAARRAQQQQLTTLSPEAGPWSADPWPAMTQAEQAAAVLAVKADAETVLKQASVSISPVETPHFIVYSELDRPVTADWALRLERIIPAMAFVLNPGIDPADGPKASTLGPWGKIVVFIWKEQDRFKMVEAESFRHLVSNATVGVCHFTGPRAIVNMRDVDDEEEFEWWLMVETSRALLHRHRTPRRLPAWANDGLAELLASRMNKHSNFGHDRREAALKFIREGGSLNAVLDLKYEDASFPGPDGLGAPVGELVVELMLNQKPANFVRWLNAVKAGKAWPESLAQEYGVPREQIVSIATQYYKVND